LLDRIDLHVDVPAVAAADLMLPPATEGSREVADRVSAVIKVELAVKFMCPSLYPSNLTASPKQRVGFVRRECCDFAMVLERQNVAPPRRFKRPTN
jgi:hypothetical protein